jgi:secreted Zn-dependent insulinase-like peptidase
VFASLQDKGWAMSNSAGTGTTYPDFTLFEASVALTESGLENWEQVVSIIYSQVSIIHIIHTLRLSPRFFSFFLLSFLFMYCHFLWCIV